ncbi:cation:proton antiporter [Paraburkholderia sediminicola]|nr:cation:proton antiporter [Paraburkholderia sediminicola]
MSIEHIVIVGFGCIGQAVLPLLKRVFPRVAITVIDKTLDAQRMTMASRYQMATIETTISPSSFAAILGPLLTPRTFLLNLVPAVCRRDLIGLAQLRGALYIDTGIEPWDYEAHAQSVHLGNHALRQDMLAFARGREALPTALVAHGANPGFVSILVKAALLRLAGKAGLLQAEPTTRAGWALLARQLDVRVIQIAEYDSQVAPGYPLEWEFANTWSADGFITECLQDAELGWGAAISTFVIGALFWGAAYLLGYELRPIYALLFGALISPTDPIAVLGIIKKVGAPKDLETRITGESLFNDGVGAVIFLTILDVATGVSKPGVASVSWFFVQETLGDIALGWFFGWAVYRLLRQIDDYQVEVLLSIPSRCAWAPMHSPMSFIGQVRSPWLSPDCSWATAGGGRPCPSRRANISENSGR